MAFLFNDQRHYHIDMAGSEDLRTTDEWGAATKGIFDFFGLPRELRDKVYGWLTQDLCLCGSDDDEENEPTIIEVRLVAAPLPKLFTLCRQFRTEYEERFKHGLTATFKDLGQEI